ncbi:MAG: 50S ribosomal protein L18, partial [Vicinamibacterales bacterium]|nr:50S ribosomal protein L18 [Vicinamibacterales bacterium]
MKIKTKADRRHRIKLRIRKRVAGTAQRPRLSVYRSVAHIYAQAIDDAAGRTLATASSGEPSLQASFATGAKGGNVLGAEAVGKAIAERLMAQGISQVVYDRNGFL